MRISPLSHGYRPPQIFLAPEGAEGGGGGGASTSTAAPAAPAAPAKAAAPPKMGGAFSKMVADLKAGESSNEPAAPEPEPTPAAPAKPAATEPKKPAAPAKKEPPKPASSTVPAAAFEPTTAEPAKKEAPAAPDELAELSKGLSDGARKNFERQKAIYEERLSKVQGELEAAKQTTGAYGMTADEVKTLKAEHDKLKAEHAEMQKTVETVALERSPQFQAKYEKGRRDLIDQAAKRVEKAGGDPKQFRAAMEKSGTARYDALGEVTDRLPDFVRTQVASLFMQVEGLEDERAQTLEDAKGNLTKWGEEEMTRRTEESKKLLASRHERFNELVPQLSSAVLFARRIPEGADGAAEWNATVDATLEGARKFLFEGNNFDEFAAAAVKAQAYDQLQGLFLTVRQQNMEYAQTIRDLTGAEPGATAGGGGGGGGGGKGGANGDRKSFRDLMKEGLEAVGNG